jgi:hypothetical protein
MPPLSANQTNRRSASIRLLHRHTLAAALLLALPVAGHGAGANDDGGAARRAAHDRHRTAVAACHQAADPAACRREADADLTVDLRQVQQLPAAGATQRHRQQQQRLLRELEQAAPRPQPPPGPTPSRRPTPGRGLDR